MSQIVRRVLVLVLLLGGAAGAQVTTVVAQPNPKRARQAADTALRRQRAESDSVARAAVTNMKAWVDSAALALPVTPDTARGTSGAARAETKAAARITPTPPRRRESAGTVAYREGAPAPATATAYPALALLGAFLLGAGLALHTWRRRRRAA